MAAIVLDVVLGYGANADPAGELAPAVREARAVAARDGRELVVLGFVCGTDDDPQGSRRADGEAARGGDDPRGRVHRRRAPRGARRGRALSAARTMRFDPKLVVVAFGGNAVYPPTIKGTAQEQLDIMEEACEHLVPVFRAGYRVVLTHGNGPVVGNILFRMARTSRELVPMPMDVCVAHSQGGIGLHAAAEPRERAGASTACDVGVSSIVTEVEVAPDDPAFTHPTKPVGRVLHARRTPKRIAAETGWDFVEDSGRGYRRVVPSPMPLRILDAPAINALLGAGVIPIAAGGGGIPVVRDGTRYRGVAAVIDKDMTSALLAADVGAGHAGDAHRRRARGARFRQAQPARARSHDRGRSAQASRGRPVPAREHGAEDHRGAALSRARRAAGADHLAREARRRRSRAGPARRSSP